jgi:ribosomal protein L40E
MSNFVESAKNMLNSAVSRTSWEAQKQLRTRSKQSEIDKLLEQRQKLLDQLTQVAMTLYQQGALTDAQLSRLCASVLELDGDVRRHEQQLQDIKTEAYPADQFAPGPTPNYTPPPVTATPVPPSNAPTPGAQAAPQGQAICPKCGSQVRPNSLYCRNCGSKV